MNNKKIFFQQILRRAGKSDQDSFSSCNNSVLPYVTGFCGILFYQAKQRMKWLMHNSSFLKSLHIFSLTKLCYFTTRLRNKIVFEASVFSTRNLFIGSNKLHECEKRCLLYWPRTMTTKVWFQAFSFLLLHGSENKLNHKLSSNIYWKYNQSFAGYTHLVKPEFK